MNSLPNNHQTFCPYLKLPLIKTMFSDVDKDKFEDGMKITLYLSRLSCA